MGHDQQQLHIGDGQRESAPNAEHSDAERPAQPAPLAMLGQLARDLRASQAAAKDPFGTPLLPGVDNRWSRHDQQFWDDLGASMSLAPAGKVLKQDAKALLRYTPEIAAGYVFIKACAKNAKTAKGWSAYLLGSVAVLAKVIGWLAPSAAVVRTLTVWLDHVERANGDPAKIEMAREKFVEFAAATGFMVLAAQRGTRPAPNGETGGVPAVQLPDLMRQGAVIRRRLAGDARALAGTTSLANSIGPVGTSDVEIDRWLMEHPFVGGAPLDPDMAQVAIHEYVAPAPQTTASAVAPRFLPNAKDAASRLLELQVAQRKLKQYFLDYFVKASEAERALLNARLSEFLTTELGVSEAMWLDLQKLNPSRLNDVLQARGFLERATSQDPTLRPYMEQLVRAYVHGNLTTQALEYYSRRAEGIMALPEATELVPFEREGKRALHFLGTVDGQSAFVKIPKRPADDYFVDRDLQAVRDLTPRGGPRWYLLVRVLDEKIGFWREAVAMKSLAQGYSIRILHDLMAAGKPLPFPVTAPHLRALKSFQTQLEHDGVFPEDEHAENYVVMPPEAPVKSHARATAANGHARESDAEGLVVPVDMTVIRGHYAPHDGPEDVSLMVRELVEYGRNHAAAQASPSMVKAAIAPKVAGAATTLRKLFKSYRPQQQGAHAKLVGQIGQVLTGLGIDESMTNLLEPLDEFHLQTLVGAKGFLEGASSSNEQLRLHVEDLATAYAGDRLPLEAYEVALSKAQTVSSLPPVTRLQHIDHVSPEKELVYRVTLNGQPALVKMPRPPQEDYRVDEYLQALRDRDPVLVRAFDPVTRVWRRAAAWRKGAPHG